MFDRSLSEDICKQKLWFDLCQYLTNNVYKYPMECYDAFIKLIIPNFNSIHSVTMTKTAIKIIDNVDIEKAQNIIKECLLYLQNIEYKTPEQNNSIFKLNTKMYTTKVYQKNTNEYNHIESFIYENKNKKMDKDGYFIFYRLCYLFYELTNNHEETYSYINKFLSFYVPIESKYSDKEESLINKLIKSALLSKDVYSFQGIFNNQFYNKLDDTNLKSLFEKISTGDIDYICKNKEMVKSVFANNSNCDAIYDFLREKTYLVAFVNVCFYSEKEVSFKDVEIKLGLKREEILYVAMMAIGKKLIKGTIDGEKETISIKYVVPRILSEEDLVEVKNKYVNWSKKIEEVIKLV
ncbi:26S proteasome regulatory subunit [Binucleata daphniae]